MILRGVFFPKAEILAVGGVKGLVGTINKTVDNLGLGAKLIRVTALLLQTEVYLFWKKHES
jgi:hypothetical protein